MWVTLVVGGVVFVVGVSVWVALSKYELWLRRSLVGFVALLVWVSLMAGVLQFRLGFRMGAVGWLLWVSLVGKGMLFDSVFCLVVVGWHVWGSLVMIDVLFGGELVVIAVGWQVWVSVVVSVVQFILELTLVGGWSVGVSRVIGGSMGGDVLLMVMGAVVWLEWGSCVVVAIVGGAKRQAS